MAHPWQTKEVPRQGRCTEDRPPPPFDGKPETRNHSRYEDRTRNWVQRQPAHCLEKENKLDQNRNDGLTRSALEDSSPYSTTTTASTEECRTPLFGKIDGAHDNEALNGDWARMIMRSYAHRAVSKEGEPNNIKHENYHSTSHVSRQKLAKIDEEQQVSPDEKPDQASQDANPYDKSPQDPLQNSQWTKPSLPVTWKGDMNLYLRECAEQRAAADRAKGTTPALMKSHRHVPPPISGGVKEMPKAATSSTSSTPSWMLRRPTYTGSDALDDMPPLERCTSKYNQERNAYRNAQHDEKRTQNRDNPAVRGEVSYRQRHSKLLDSLLAGPANRPHKGTCKACRDAGNETWEEFQAKMTGCLALLRECIAAEREAEVAREKGNEGEGGKDEDEEGEGDFDMISLLSDCGTDLSMVDEGFEEEWEYV